LDPAFHLPLSKLKLRSSWTAWDEKAKKVLSSVLAGAEDFEKARKQLETWFNNSMERVTGAYKLFAILALRFSEFGFLAAPILQIWQ
jgi:hypothetical protein